MSKIPNNSYFVPRSLKQHPLWLSASLHWRVVLDWLMEHAAYKDGYPFDNNGTIINLKKGQVGFTFRHVSEACFVSKDHVEGALKHFSGESEKSKTILHQNSHQRILQQFLQESRQKKRKEKSVYNILIEGYYETSKTSIPTMIPTMIPTTIPPTFLQHSDIKKKEKKEKEDISGSKEPSTSLAAKPPSSPEFSISKETVREALIAKGFVKREDQEQLFKSWGASKVWIGLQFIFSDDFIIEQTPIQALNWVCKTEAWKKPKLRKISPKEVVEAHFVDGRVYNGYMCGMNSISIWFYAVSGTKFQSLYDDKFFSTKFAKFCEEIGLENPFKKTFNIMEA